MRIYIFLLLLLVTSGLWSQVRKTDERIIAEEMRYSSEKKFNTWALTAGYGPLVMFADISNKSIFTNSKIGFAPSIILSKQLAPSLAIDLQYLSGKMNGTNGTYYFKGDFHEGTVSAVVFLNQLTASPGPINDKWNLYLKVGVGATAFRSRLYFEETDLLVRKLDIGQESGRFLVIGYDDRDDQHGGNPDVKKDRRMEIIVPATAGLMYRINKSFDVAWETSMRFCASDNLDNILSGSTNDRYLFSGLHLSYKIGKKDKRHMRWTYRGYGFDLFGRPKKDPMENEIAQLEDEINKYREARPIKRDSVVIMETLTVIYETTDVRTIFFPAGGAITFDTEDQILMAEAVVQMKQHPGTKLQIYSHVSPQDVGDHLELSQKQCDKIANFLVNDLGADASLIELVPMGSDAPLTGEGELSTKTIGDGVLSSSKVKQMANRRVDMVFKR